jgi:phycobilisome core component
MKDMLKEMAASQGVENTSFIDEPFEYMTRELSELSI